MLSKKLPSENAPSGMTSDKDVLTQLNNSAIIMARWEGLRTKTLNGALLKRYVDAFLDDAIDSVTVYRRDGDGICLPQGERRINDKELALVLMLALTKLVFQQVLPEDTDAQEGLVASVLRGKVRS